MGVTVHPGDCMEILPTLPADSFHSVVTDPPYHLTSIVKRFGGANAAPAKPGTDGAYARASRGFMGKVWDGGDIAFRPETWAEVFRVMKPGAHLLAFSATRTYHRMVCAIEDAGFEIRDQIGWLYGSGFPKSHNVGKAIDKAAGAEREVIATRAAAVGFDTERQGGGGWAAGEIATTAPATPEAAEWEGWGTALKPAWEPVVVARKPLVGTVAENVLQHGTGPLNIDACRIETEEGANLRGGFVSTKTAGWDRPWKHDEVAVAACKARGLEAAQHAESLGRWPANVIHDGSPEVVEAFARYGDKGGAGHIERRNSDKFGSAYGTFEGRRDEGWIGYQDGGTAARFFYAAKADKSDRLGSKHPTVKPVALMRYLLRLVTPPGGMVLDPFAGSGTTGMAALAEGFDAHLIESEADSVADIRRRIAHVEGADTPLFAGIEP